MGSIACETNCIGGFLGCGTDESIIYQRVLNQSPVLTYTLHRAGTLSQSNASSGNPDCTTISLIALSSSSVSNLPCTVPLIVTLCRCFLKIRSDRFTYAVIQSSMVIWRRPSMMAISLYVSVMDLFRQCNTNPPVLVPPIMSKYSQGFGGASGLMVSMSCFKIWRADNPRTPPPSRDRRHNSLPDIVVIYHILGESGQIYVRIIYSTPYCKLCGVMYSICWCRT